MHDFIGGQTEERSKSVHGVQIKRGFHRKLPRRSDSGWLFYFCRNEQRFCRAKPFKWAWDGARQKNKRISCAYFEIIAVCMVRIRRTQYEQGEI